MMDQRIWLADINLSNKLTARVCAGNYFTVVLTCSPFHFGSFQAIHNDKSFKKLSNLPFLQAIPACLPICLPLLSHSDPSIACKMFKKTRLISMDNHKKVTDTA